MECVNPGHVSVALSSETPGSLYQERTRAQLKSRRERKQAEIHGEQCLFLNPSPAPNSWALLPHWCLLCPSPWQQVPPGLKLGHRGRRGADQALRPHPPLTSLPRLQTGGAEPRFQVAPALQGLPTGPPGRAPAARNHNQRGGVFCPSCAGAEGPHCLPTAASLSPLRDPSSPGQPEGPHKGSRHPGGRASVEDRV